MKSNDSFPKQQQKEFMILYVDAAKTEGKTDAGRTCGKTAWRGVTDMDGKVELFRCPPQADTFFELGHNNCAEFCALIDGIQFLSKTPEKYEQIYTDSVTARSWVLQGKTNCTIREQLGSVFRQEFEKRELWLKANHPILDTIKQKITLWDKKKEKLENPADFGNKKNPKRRGP